MKHLIDRSHPAFTCVHPWAVDGLGHVSHTQRYVFIATPKVACSSILMTLQRLERGDPGLVHAQPHEVHLPHLSPLEPMSRNFDRLIDSDYVKWCFVRNPFDRLMSCWMEKVHDGPMRPMFEEILGRHGKVSFENFVRVACSQPLDEMDAHYAPQYYITFQDAIAYDFTGRFEMLERHLVSIFERIGADYHTYAAVIDSQRTGPKPYELITPELKKLIVATYACDFLAFGYSMEVPVAKRSQAPATPANPFERLRKAG